MKRQILFIQGAGSGTHDEWDNRLVENLERALGANDEIRYPRMPHEQDPLYGLWKPAIERELAKLEDHAILIGHSIGGTMLTNTLAEQSTSRRFGALLLIAAPFVGDGGWSSDELKPSRDLGARLPDMPIHIYHGMKDETVPTSHADLYAAAIPQARIHRLSDRDHQLNNDMSELAASIRSLGKR